PVDRLPPSPYGEGAREHPSLHRLDDTGTGVRDNRQPRKEQHDRQGARGVGGRNRVETREGDGDRRPVEGLEPRLLEDEPKPDRPGRERERDRGEKELRLTEPDGH